MPVITASTSTNQQQATFIGLESYSEDQADMFFGRDEEIKNLYRLIKTNTLTVLFGKSGTGKTSLLNAGVFPRLRENYCLPFRIRLEFFDNSPNLVVQIKNVLRTEIDKYSFQVKSYPGDETLWEYFHTEQLWSVVTPILIFDQFEEIFTLAARSSKFNKPQLDEFFEELGDLIENSIPEKIKERFLNNQQDDTLNYNRQKAKLIFSFREDFLPEIESLTARIPSAKNSHFRLRQMTGSQALEVIIKSWGTFIDKAEAKKIISFLTNDTDENTSNDLALDDIQIEPSLLSQVCSFLERQRKNEKLEKITAQFLETYSKQKILRTLYEEVLNDSLAKLPPAALNQNPSPDKKLPPPNPVKVFIEDQLITDEGYRIKYDVQEIDEDLKPGIEVVKKKYFIREEGDSVELTHDVIVSLVKSDREERRKQLALAAERLKAKRKMRMIVAGASAAVLLIWLVLAVPAWFAKEEFEHQKDDLVVEIDSLTHVKNSLILAEPKNKPKPPPKGGAKSPPTTTAPVPETIPDAAATLAAAAADSARQARRSRYAALADARKKQDLQMRNRQIELNEQARLLAVEKQQVEAEQQRLADKQKALNELAAQQKALPKPIVAPVNTTTIRVAPKPLISTKPPRQQKGKIYGYGHDYAVDSTRTP